MVNWTEATEAKWAVLTTFRLADGELGVAGWRVVGLGFVARGYFRPLDNECAGGGGSGEMWVVGSCLFISGRPAAGLSGPPW